MTTETVGQLLNDRYRILETIGQGGFGTTYKAIDTTHPDQKLCVIKQFTFVGKNKDTALELFYRESKHLKTLGDHQQIPTLIESFDVDGQPYLVQQYIDGQNLEQELKVEIFTQESIRELLDSLLPVLAYVHDHQLIHRDIKPANIIRQAHDGKLFLVDFGAVKLATQTTLAKTGTSIGSAEFASIEQGRGKATQASDIYSLGVTCINLLTGVSPFDLMTQDNDWCWRDYLGGNPVDKDFGEILDKMIAQSQSGRYKSANEVMKEIDTAGENNLRKEVDLASSLRKAKKDVEKARFFAKTSKSHGVLDEVRLEKAEERLREVIQQMSDQGAVLDIADRKDNGDNLASARRKLSDANNKPRRSKHLYFVITGGLGVAGATLGFPLLIPALRSFWEKLGKPTDSLLGKPTNSLFDGSVLPMSSSILPLVDSLSFLVMTISVLFGALNVIRGIQNRENIAPVIGAAIVMPISMGLMLGLVKALLGMILV